MKVYKCDYRRIDKKGNLVMYNAEVIGEVNDKTELNTFYYQYNTQSYSKYGKMPNYMISPMASYPGKKVILRESKRYKDHMPSLES